MGGGGCLRRKPFPRGMCQRTAWGAPTPTPVQKQEEPGAQRLPGLPERSACWEVAGSSGSPRKPHYPHLPTRVSLFAFPVGERGEGCHLRPHWAQRLHGRPQGDVSAPCAVRGWAGAGRRGQRVAGWTAGAVGSGGWTAGRVTAPPSAHTALAQMVCVYVIVIKYQKVGR